MCAMKKEGDMFSVEKFYQDAHGGDTVEAEELCKYFKGGTRMLLYGERAILALR